MRQISFQLVDTGSVSAYFTDASGKYRVETIARDHRNYDAIKKAIYDDNVPQLEELLDVKKVLINYTNGHIEIKDSVIHYAGEPIQELDTERILTMMDSGLPFEPTANFIENVMQNISNRAIQELYKFLSHRALPITEDGCFLAYKHVRDDWTDIWTGKVDNHIGQTPNMARNRVDDDFRHDCSRGFHAGTIEYAAGYTGNGCENGGHIVIVKINPKDVVSVPEGDDSQKLRCCTYTVLSEYKSDLLMPLYTSMGQAYLPDLNDPEEEDPWEDESEDTDFDDGEEDEDFEDDVLGDEIHKPPTNDSRVFFEQEPPESF